MTIVDSNILIDLLTRDPIHFEASRKAFEKRMAAGPLFIVDVIFSELCPGFASAQDCAESMEALSIVRIPMQQDALWLAASAFTAYRAKGGAKKNVLPDFFIGAQAQVMKTDILTRDVARFETYFPEVKLVTP